MERCCHVFFDIMNNAVSRREEYSEAKLSQNLAKIREGKNEHTCTLEGSINWWLALAISKSSAYCKVN